MKIKKLAISILIIAMIAILNSVNIFAIAPIKREVYNTTSLIISFIMKGLMAFGIILYIVSSIIYIIKSKTDKNEKIKKIIKWLAILVVVSLVLWFGSEEVKKIGMTIKYEGKPYLRFR